VTSRTKRRRRAPGKTRPTRVQAARTSPQRHGFARVRGWMSWLKILILTTLTILGALLAIVTYAFGIWDRFKGDAGPLRHEWSSEPSN
jgi:hypothetical protein